MTHLEPTLLGWLLASDPALRWQVQRDLADAPEAAWQAERAKVETEGWGARLLAHQDADGQWAGGAFLPKGFTREEWQAEGQPWTSTCFAVQQLRQFGLEPRSARAQRTVALLREHCRWDHDGEPYWAGEVEECINGRTLADGAYFGVDVSGIAARLLGEVQPDGGWNCERANGSQRSSFATTINVLEGLLAFERATGGSVAVRAARRSGEEFLLARQLYLRRSTGEAADPAFLRLAEPNRWRYDTLRALEHFREASLVDGTAPDPRLALAVAALRSRRRPDGRWSMDERLRGRVWFDMEPGPGEPSRWITLRAMRVLRWWGAS